MLMEIFVSSYYGDDPLINEEDVISTKFIIRMDTLKSSVDIFYKIVSKAINSSQQNGWDGESCLDKVLLKNDDKLVASYINFDIDVEDIDQIINVNVNDVDQVINSLT